MQIPWTKTAFIGHTTTNPSPGPEFWQTPFIIVNPG